MSRRVVILTEIISPYRIPLFNSLAEDGEVSPHVIFLSETDPNLRQWRIYKEEIQFSHRVLPSWRRRLGKFNVLLNWSVTDSLNEAAPDAILCGGYSYLASWQALQWARTRDVPFLLWSESNLQDARSGHAPVELMKMEFLQQCTGFVVPGQSARDYLRGHKIPEHKIFIAPNAVDNDFFRSAAEQIRSEPDANRQKLGLPNRYVLFVGRLVGEKGVFDLLNAYAGLDEPLRRQVGLVFAGDGSARKELERAAAAISCGPIKFAGFVHREGLPRYYALADMLVLPTYTDTWGLVVNEAMACGLPVIVSEAAGCVRDLVREGWNGRIIVPRNTSSLTLAIRDLAVRPELCVTMGANSLLHITQFSPRAWSSAVSLAVTSTTSLHG